MYRYFFKNIKKTLTGLRYSLYFQPPFNGHSPRRSSASSGVGHVVLTKIKCIPTVIQLGHFRVPKTLTFLVKMSFICMRMKNHFHIKGWALNLVLIQGPGGTRKWPLQILPRWWYNNTWSKHGGKYLRFSFPVPPQKTQKIYRSCFAPRLWKSLSTTCSKSRWKEAWPKSWEKRIANFHFCEIEFQCTVRLCLTCRYFHNSSVFWYHHKSIANKLIWNFCTFLNINIKIFVVFGRLAFRSSQFTAKWTTTLVFTTNLSLDFVMWRFNERFLLWRNRI